MWAVTSGELLLKRAKKNRTQEKSRNKNIQGAILEALPSHEGFFTQAAPWDFEGHARG